MSVTPLSSLFIETPVDLLEGLNAPALKIDPIVNKISAKILYMVRFVANFVTAIKSARE